MDNSTKEALVKTHTHTHTHTRREREGKRDRLRERGGREGGDVINIMPDGSRHEYLMDYNQYSILL